MRRKRLFLAFLGWLGAGLAHPQTGADGWITHPEASATPVVLEFRREVEIRGPVRQWPVAVTADQRFILFVNGRRVGSGPSTGTMARWRVSSLDLAPYLRRGRNEISAVVWNFGEHAPLAQQSLATGFRLLGGEFGTNAAGWQVRLKPGHTATSGSARMRPEYYVASAPEIIDARVGPGAWVDAVAAPAAARRTLIDDALPPQEFAAVPAGDVVRTDLAGGNAFPAKPVVVRERSHAKLLLRRDAMVSAYPELRVRGGRDAKIVVTYAEALYDSPRKKVDRDVVGERPIDGIADTFIAKGGDERFMPLWWRTWRYLEIDVTTADEPLVLESLRVHETGYPFTQVGRFDSDDEELDRIFEIGWRTLRVDAHETFMDSSYWEQLQYAGDTRIEMLISYAMSGDARLGRQAIDAFAESNVEGGIMEGAYPSRGRNVITTFSLAWISMLHDWWREQPDIAVIRPHLPRMRQVLDWFEKLKTPSGLLGANPHWNFIDWAGQRWDDRTVFPSYGKNGGSCLMTVLWLGALREAADLEREVGASADSPALASNYSAKAARAHAAIRQECWDARRGLFADNPDRDVFSQHMNALAVLHDVATREEARGILDRVVVPGRGIDAPDGMFTTTYYFAWYLVRAFEHAGLAGRYVDLLQTWRGLLALNYTTWPESRGDTRSDTHAWSAHPTSDLLAIVAGIQSGAPGYARLRIEPHLGALTRLDATAATPRGPVSVSYRLRGDTWTAEILAPRDLPGEFVWHGKAQPLTGKKTVLRLPR
jgi:alpha-L-rhamnosidase